MVVGLQTWYTQYVISGESDERGQKENNRYLSSTSSLSVVASCKSPMTSPLCALAIAGLMWEPGKDEVWQWRA